MLVLTNTTAQTLQPGQSLTFDRVLFQSGSGECWRAQNGRIPTTSARMLAGNGTYATTFHGNIGGTAAGPVQIAMAVDGAVLPETTMISTTAAAGDLNNVSASTRLRNACGCNGDRISVVNNGTVAVTIGANSALILERRG